MDLAELTCDHTRWQNENLADLRMAIAIAVEYFFDKYKTMD
jgi:hypothetical protein